MKQWKIKQKKKKDGFLGILLGIPGASLLGNLVTDKEVKRSKIPGRGLIRVGEWVITAGQYI